MWHRCRDPPRQYRHNQDSCTMNDSQYLSRRINIQWGCRKFCSVLTANADTWTWFVGTSDGDCSRRWHRHHCFRGDNDLRFADGATSCRGGRGDGLVTCAAHSWLRRNYISSTNSHELLPHLILRWISTLIIHYCSQSPSLWHTLKNKVKWILLSAQKHAWFGSNGLCLIGLAKISRCTEFLWWVNVLFASPKALPQQWKMSYL